MPLDQCHRSFCASFFVWTTFHSRNFGNRFQHARCDSFTKFLILYSMVKITARRTFLLSSNDLLMKNWWEILVEIFALSNDRTEFLSWLERLQLSVYPVKTKKITMQVYKNQFSDNDCIAMYAWVCTYYYEMSTSIFVVSLSLFFYGVYSYNNQRDCNPANEMQRTRKKNIAFSKWYWWFAS